MKRRTFLKSLGAIGLATALPIPHTFAQTPQFLTPPTVHHLTEQTATLFFRVGLPNVNGLVQISQAGSLIQEIPFTAASLSQQIKIEDLEPATTYQYQVLVDGSVLSVLGLEMPWDQLEFTTPPYAYPLRVGAMGDSGFGDETTIQLAQMMAAQEPDLFFHLGDVVYWMHEYNNDPYLNWNIKYFKPFQTLLSRMPHYPTIGNHEYDGPAKMDVDGQPSYYWMFPPFNGDQNEEGMRSWYSFDYNGIQFLSLNSQLFYSYARYREPQEAWLDEKLARTDVLYTVVFCHIPPYTSASPHQWDGMYMAEQWVPKFEASNVALVMGGHAHAYERLELNGIHYIVAGNGSATIYGMGERQRHSQNFWNMSGFPIFDFYEDRIHLTAYAKTGEIMDDLDLPLRG